MNTSHLVSYAKHKATKNTVWKLTTLLILILMFLLQQALQRCGQRERVVPRIDFLYTHTRLGSLEMYKLSDIKLELTQSQKGFLDENNLN